MLLARSEGHWRLYLGGGLRPNGWVKIAYEPLGYRALVAWRCWPLTLLVNKEEVYVRPYEAGEVARGQLMALRRFLLGLVVVVAFIFEVALAASVVAWLFNVWGW